MKRVVTFCLWGKSPRYNVGLIKNVELVKKMYPGYEAWVYIHAQTIPGDTVNKLREFDHVKILVKSGDLNKCKPMTWRFEAIDDPDVEIMLSRDIDTRIVQREVDAVNEWLESDKLFHIMRDHPYHNSKIFGGMFGTKKIPEVSSWKAIIDKHVQRSNYMYDVHILDLIYIFVKDRAMIHTSFRKFPGEKCKPFPTPFDKEYRFVGEYIDEHGNRTQKHVNVLKAKYKK